ncbi:hypothetical protein HYDPIDRAFT_24702 [Hydnomerulius pinastri MD-312]|nr:hypothetical protein HYDPIDRAFT_24702 [Hydnomerulius pinastri MD-312]
MRQSFLFAFLALPILSLAQSAQVSTSWIVQETLGPNRQISTISQATVITIAPAPAPSGTGSGSNSGTASGGNSSGASNASGGSGGNATSTSTTPANLPTAASAVPGADGGPNGAPSPGASAPGGIYGPPDGYIAGAEALRSAGMVSFVACAVGGALLLV